MVAAEVRRFVDLFLSHALIVELPGVQENGGEPIFGPAAEDRLDWPGGWFEAYSDMKELLLLDPVHDVGDGAWPPKPDITGR